MSTIFARTICAASRTAPLHSTALRLPPVPGPYGVALVSPRMIVTLSTGTPSSSAATWAAVVSTLWPWLALLVATSTRPFVVMLDARRLAGQRAHGDARRLDVQPDADADAAGPRPAPAACSARNAA